MVKAPNSAVARNRRKTFEKIRKKTHYVVLLIYKINGFKIREIMETTKKSSKVWFGFTLMMNATTLSSFFVANRTLRTTMLSVPEKKADHNVF